MQAQGPASPATTRSQLRQTGTHLRAHPGCNPRTGCGTPRPANSRRNRWTPNTGARTLTHCST
eukprot:12902609-Prorocentrum_lima.AAC.1